MPSNEIQRFEDAWTDKYLRLIEAAESTVTWIERNAHNDYVREQMLRAVYVHMFGDKAA